MRYEDLVILTSWLAERGSSANTVAYAVEKPWKFADELSLARAVHEHEQEHPTGPVHQCQESADGSGRWVCGPEWIDGIEQFCGWEWVPQTAFDPWCPYCGADAYVSGCVEGDCKSVDA